MDNNLNRRDFLRAIGLGAAAGITMPVFSLNAKEAVAGKKWRMKLSTSSNHFLQLPIEQACERIAKLGFEAIDIWSKSHLDDGLEPHLNDVAKRLGPDGLRKLLAKHNLKLASFTVYSGYPPYAELLGKFGGGVAVRGSGEGPCKPKELTTRMRKFIEGLKPLVELAEKYNSYLAIENHIKCLLNSLDSFKAFVDINTSPRLGIALAPPHIQRLKASVPEAIRVCGKQIFFFYAWQLTPTGGESGPTQLPGIGPADMTPWIQVLADIRYDRYVNIFMHGHGGDAMTANLAKSRDYLKACYEKVSLET